MKLDFKNAMKSAVDAGAFSEILTLARTQNPDATLRIGSDGSLNIRTLGMDSVTVVDLNGVPGFFTGEIPEGPIGVEIDRWLEALKKCKGDAVLEWISGAVRITAGKLSTVLRLFEPTDLSRFPNVELNASAMFDPSPLKDLLSSIPPKVFSPWTVEISEDGLTVSSYEDTGLGSSVTLKPDEMIVLSADPEGPQSADFPRDHWGRLIKALPAGPIGVELHTDFPCKVTFGGDTWSGAWVCAPMILDAEE